MRGGLHDLPATGQRETAPGPTNTRRQPAMTPARLQTLRTALDRRQPDLTVVMENVCKPHNLAAVARTLEAVGGLEIHAISQLRSLRLSQMSAAGVRKWIRVHKHADIDDAARQLHAQGYQLIATTLSDTASDFRDIDYTRPSAIVVGEEYDGLSTRASALADHHVFIPMYGMVQSLNVSVASALVLYEACRQREAAGMYASRRLDEASYRKLLFEACHPQVAAYCRQRKLPYPAIDDQAQIIGTVAGSGQRQNPDFAHWMKNLEG